MPGADLLLKPVNFYYNNDGTNTPQFGLIAEEVAKVNPNLVVRDKTGEIYNEFLKEHREVEKLEATACNSRRISRRRSCVAEKNDGYRCSIE